MESSTVNATQAASPRPLRSYDQLPGPRGIPWLGNALQIDVLHFHQQLEQWRHEFGPRARMQTHPALRKHPRNLLEAMVAAADQPESGIDDEQVAGSVLTMLLAGEDTIANTLAWMIHLLWLNPKALARAAEEVRRVVHDPANPTLDEMAQLNYVEACAHETMRLKPVAPILPLQAVHDATVGDVRVPAGVIIQNIMRSDSVSDIHLPRRVVRARALASRCR